MNRLEALRQVVDFPDTITAIRREAPELVADLDDAFVERIWELWSGMKYFAGHMNAAPSTVKAFVEWLREEAEQGWGWSSW